MRYPRVTFSKHPLTATFVLLFAACMVVGSIFCPYAPYHREGDTFVGKMGRPATAAQYRLSRYLECTLLVSWICGALSMLYETTSEDWGQKTGGSPRNAGVPDRVKPDRQQLRSSESADIAASGEIAPAETLFGTDHGEARCRLVWNACNA